MMTRLAFIGGGENAASYTTVTPRLPNVAFVAVVHPEPDVAQCIADSLGASITANSLDDFYLDDPLPFFGQVLYYASNSLAKMSLNPSEKGMVG